MANEATDSIESWVLSVAIGKSRMLKFSGVFISWWSWLKIRLCKLKVMFKVIRRIQKSSLPSNVSTVTLVFLMSLKSTVSECVAMKLVPTNSKFNDLCRIKWVGRRISAREINNILSRPLFWDLHRKLWRFIIYQHTTKRLMNNLSINKFIYMNSDFIWILIHLLYGFICVLFTVTLLLIFIEFDLLTQHIFFRSVPKFYGVFFFLKFHLYVLFLKYLYFTFDRLHRVKIIDT